MTNAVSDSISSLFAYLGDSNSSASATSNNGDQFMALLDSLDGGSSGSGNSSIDDLFGGSSSGSSTFGLSSAAFSMLGMSSGSGSGSSIDAMAVQDTLAGNGPLPAFLKQEDGALGLNTQQAQAFQNIAIQNMNTDGSQSSINQIAAELQQAGIG